MKPVTVYFDGMCMLRRAASGFTAGEHYVAFNFFRSLRAIVEKVQATRAVLALEGTSAARRAADPSYKSNRGPADAGFYAQCGEVISLLREHFPVSVVRHPELEADDVIARMVRSSSTAVESVIVSTDRDFLQLVAEEPGSRRLLDPVQRVDVEMPPGVGSFLVWRALRGDSSDCVPRLTSDLVAADASCDERKLRALLESGDVDIDRFALNVKLLSFADPHDGEDGWVRMESSSPRRDWDAVALQFSMWEFRSLLKDMAKFITPFERLWASHNAGAAAPMESP